jgi:hypothetical protein
MTNGVIATRPVRRQHVGWHAFNEASSGLGPSGHSQDLATTIWLIVDDAHDLSLEHLMFPKELTDQGRLQYDHPPGLCLATLGRGNSMPLKEIFDQPDTMWLQCGGGGRAGADSQNTQMHVFRGGFNRTQTFLESGVLLVECPDYARTRTLSPHNGVLRFPAHSKRKTCTSHIEQRWAMEKTIWEVVAGERK